MLNLTDSQQDAKHQQLVDSAQWVGPNVPYIAIISAEKTDVLLRENRKRHAALGSDIEHSLNIPKLEVYGSYRGSEERSWMVVLSSERLVRDDQLERLVRLATDYSQESVLISDRYRNTYLYYCEPRIQVLLGRLRQATRDEALAEEAWTYNPVTDTYWIVK